ncbi:hypothetical protein B0H12DRAFT_1136929 [Mycena haematopus]|nr:hypothetical protein B0H12DRAFT_1136929 [Mycena haematopus]
MGRIDSLTADTVMDKVVGWHRGMGAIKKGWIAVEDGQQKLSDGNFIPRGRGSAAMRVEEYWQRKGAAGQHLYADTFLRVKLNQVTNGNQRIPSMTSVPIQSFTPQTQAQMYSNPAIPVPTTNMEELGRAVFNAMRLGSPAQGQYVQTRSGAHSVAFADPPEQDF